MAIEKGNPVYAIVIRCSGCERVLEKHRFDMRRVEQEFITCPDCKTDSMTGALEWAHMGVTSKIRFWLSNDVVILLALILLFGFLCYQEILHVVIESRWRRGTGASTMVLAVLIGALLNRWNWKRQQIMNSKKRLSGIAVNEPQNDPVEW